MYNVHVHVHVLNTCIVMYTCTCNSCLMVFTVYGICTARGLYVHLYFRGQSPRKYIQHEGGTIPCTDERADLYR